MIQILYELNNSLTILYIIYNVYNIKIIIFKVLTLFD